MITAGDTGNDRAMLTCGVRGVVVANRAPELFVLEERDDPKVYFARGRFAAGVLEGIRHHRIQSKTGQRIDPATSSRQPGSEKLRGLRPGGFARGPRLAMCHGSQK